MARFRGTVQGGRGQASRLGHATSGLAVEAMSYSGDVYVRMYAWQDEDHVLISVHPHGRGLWGLTIYDGPVAQLLDQSSRKTMLTALSCEMLADPNA